MPDQISASNRPKLAGEKIVLEPFSNEHLTQRYVDWLNDPEVCRYNSHGSRVYTLDEAAKYLKEIQSAASKHVFAILTKEGLHIGNIGLYVSEKNRSGEIAILIGDKAWWSKGIATQAYTLVMEYAFKTLGLHRLHSGFVTSNTGMRRALEKLGFSKEGHQKDAFFKNGRYEDIELWAILK